MEDRFNKTYEIIGSVDLSATGKTFKPDRPSPCDPPCSCFNECRGSYKHNCIRLLLKNRQIKEVDKYQYYLKEF